MRHDSPCSFEAMRARIVSDELEMVAQMVEQLAERLCSDPVITERHSRELQTFDLICQLQRSLAAALRSNTAAEVLGGCVLEELATRLSAGFSAPPVVQLAASRAGAVAVG
jgi:hypothetical protein